MNDIVTFNSPEFGFVRSVTVEDKPYFVGKDVAVILGYSNTRKALIDHVDDEDKTDGVTIRDPIGRDQTPVLINESGLYSLILSSKLPSARSFKRWVTSEVLPAIRKNGGYATVQKATPEEYLRAAQIVAECQIDRLPYVLRLLKQGGIEIAPPKDFQCHPVKRDLEGMTARYIEAAIQHGMSVRSIGRATGEHPQQISRIRLGQSKPKMDKAIRIITAIRELCPDVG